VISDIREAPSGNAAGTPAEFGHCATNVWIGSSIPLPDKFFAIPVAETQNAGAATDGTRHSGG
jgi:hypothetical protein